MRAKIKKSTWLLSVVMLAAFVASAQNADIIIGKWKDADHPEKQLEMYSQDGKYFGKSINDRNKPSKNGTIIFKDLVWSEKTKNYQGILISPENNEEFKIVVRLIDNNKFQFKVSKFIFTKSFTFKRID